MFRAISTHSARNLISAGGYSPRNSDGDCDIDGACEGFNKGVVDGFGARECVAKGVRVDEAVGEEFVDCDVALISTTHQVLASLARTTAR